MFIKFISLKQKQSYLVVGLVWILLWLVPWGKLPSIQEGNFLAFFTDMLRLGIALLAFLFPGALLYILLKDEDKLRPLFPGVIPIGFTFSVLFIAVIGLTGRMVGIPFVAVKFAFAFIGLVELFLLPIVKPNYAVNKQELSSSLHNALTNPPLVFALFLTTLMTFTDNLFFIDDTTYLAYLTNWQQATQLGFRNIVHEIDAMEQARFWLAMYPMGQALLADLSGLPGVLLLGNYLEFFLVLLAVITSYWFARALEFSRKAAGFAVLIQITLYVWMMGDHFPVGMWFYQSMSEDKVSAAFILAPVFFIFGLDFILGLGKRKWLLYLGAGLSLTFTHPVLLFFASCISLSVSALALITKRTEWRDVFKLVGLVVIIMLPYLFIRMADNNSPAEMTYDAVKASDSYQIERYTRVVNNIFYGLNPDVLKFMDFEMEDGTGRDLFQAFRLIPLVIVLIAGVISLLNLRKGPKYWYILSCILLITIATVPYTGWILGYFVSARLISRASWFLPLGLGAVLFLKLLANWLRSNHAISRKIYRRAENFSGTLWGIVACLVFISPVLAFYFLPRIPAYFQVLDHNKQLARVGAFIDQNTDRPVMAIALDYEDTQYLPGVSAHTRVISFREEKDFNPHNYFLPVEIVHERMYASNVIQSLDETVSLNQRCTMIQKYDIKYILTEYSSAVRYERLVGACGKSLTVAFETDALVLFSVNE